MKKSRKKRSLSLLLAIIMVLGMVPLSAFPVLAEPVLPEGGFVGNPEWIFIGNHDEISKSDKAWLEDLQELVKTDNGPRYIRLTEEIDADIITKNRRYLSVKGEVHMDLNGHALIAHDDDKRDDRTALITVENNAQFYLYDSSGKDSEIFFDTYMKDFFRFDPGWKNIIQVESNGLFVQYGGHLKAGRSKKVWVVSGSKPGTFNFVYNGYANRQFGGTGVTVKNNARYEMYGGKVTGRMGDALLAANGAIVRIYDGRFVGNGGADAIYTSSESDCKIYGGYFEVNNLGLTITSWYGDAYVEEIPYGKLGISADDQRIQGRVVLDKGNHCAEVIPQKGQDTYLTLTSSWGEGMSCLWEKDKNAYFTANYTPFYDSQEYLDYDYNPDSFQKLQYFWKILDSNGKAVAQYAPTQPATATKVNLNSVLWIDNNTNKTFNFEVGKEYTVSLLVRETWSNYYTRKFEAEQSCTFRVTDLPITGVSLEHFGVGQSSIPRYNTEGYADFNLSIPQSVIDSLEYMKSKNMINDYSTKSYIMKKKNLGGYSDIMAGRAVDDEGNIISDSHADRFIVTPVDAGIYTVRIVVNIIMNNGTVEQLSGYKDIYSMEKTTVKLGDGNAQTATLEQYVVPAGQKAVLDSPLTVVGPKAEDIQWYYYDFNEDQWQFCREGEMYSFSDGAMTTDITGHYRAGVYYNGIETYSPYEVIVIGRKPGELRTAALTVSNTNPAFKDNTTLNIDINWSGASWSTNRTYYFKFIADKSSPNTKTMVGANPRANGNNSSISLWTMLSRATNSSSLIPGRYCFQGFVVDNADGKKIFTEEIYITVPKDSSGVTVSANGKQLNTDGSSENLSYVMEPNTDTVRFEMQRYPDNATRWSTNGTNPTVTWTSSNISVATIDNYGKLTALKPGTVNISLQVKNSQITYNYSIAVTIPIAGFTYQMKEASLGMRYRDLAPTVTSVWSYNGTPITSDCGSYLKSLVSSVNDSGSDASLDKTVKYNQQDRIVYAFKPTTGNEFPMKVGYMYSDGDADYMADADTVITNGGERFEMTASEYGLYGWENSDDYSYRSWKYGSSRSNASLLLDETLVVKDPDAEYLTRIELKADFPGVGDPRYVNSVANLPVTLETLEGAQSDTPGFNISVSNWVCKLNNVIIGSGRPFDDSSVETSLTKDLTDWNAAYGSIGADGTSTAGYTNGIYVNEMSVYIPADYTVNGVRYCIDPEAVIVINGIRVASKVSYMNEGASKISAEYYFDVGEIKEYKEAAIDGIKAPVVGEKPQIAEDVTVRGNSELSVGDFMWYVDKNKDGKLQMPIIDSNGNITDYGELAAVYYNPDGTYDTEHSLLANDGTFLPNTEYSLYVEVGLGENAAGRIKDSVFSLKLNVGEQDKQIAYGKVSGSYTFAKTDKAILTAVDYTMDTLAVGGLMQIPTLNEDIAGLAETTGFSITQYDWSGNQVRYIAYGNINDGHYYEAGKYSMWIQVNCTENYIFDSNTTVTVDGNPVTVSDRHSNYITFTYEFTVGTPPTSGVTVSGSFTSFGGDTNTTIHLIENGESEPTYEFTGAGTKSTAAYTGTWSIDNVLPGTYTVKVSKANHVTREYEITVDSSPVTQDVKICLKGDVTGDGNVNTSDVGRANAHAKNSSLLTDYAFKCVDVTGDGNVNTSDVGRINAHAKGSNPLWK